MSYRFESQQHICRWTNGETKIEFSDSYIDTFNGIVDLTDVKDILYYYYSVNMYMKDCDDNWYPMVSAYAHDFPAILSLQKNLTKYLQENEEILRIHDKHIDDDYSIVRHEYDGQYFYDLTLRGMYHGEKNNVLQCATIVGLSKSDLEVFKLCVDEFIRESMQSYSRSTNARFEFDKQNKQVKDNKLYVWERQIGGKIKLSHIYVPGDKFDFITYWEEYGDTFIERNCPNVVIEKVDEVYEILYATDGREFDLSKITFFMYEEPTQKLTYDIQKIVCDFYGILSDTEKLEFKQTSVDELFQTYLWPIINRSWMCRSEHEFEEKYPKLLQIEDTGKHERVFEVVKWIIQEIKNM